MSTYPGENPQPSDGEEPADGTEPTQPVGYWERQAAEKAAESARQQPDEGRPGPTTPYPQEGGPAFYPTYGQPTYGGQPAAYPTPPGPPPGQPGPPPGQPGPPANYYAPAPGGMPGQPPYTFSPVLPAHPQSTMAMVLGLIGLIGAIFSCGLTLVVSPFAWVVGHSALKEIKASQGRLGGESQARSGMIMGIVGTVLLILAILAVIAFFVLLVVSSDTTSSGSSV